MTTSDAIAQAAATAREAWPGVTLDDATFASYAGERLGDDPANPCLVDLWLACAIVRADPAALRVFEDQYLVELGAAIAHLDGGTALVGDVTSAVRERVLAAEAGGQAKLAEYRGRGDLRGWLRVVAVREALQIMRKRKRETPISHEPEALADKIDTSLTSALTPDERRVYRDAFTSALATLTARERNLLRQQYLYGATIDELGALYGVHRSTAARWIAEIREALLRRTRRLVGEALSLSGDELDSVMGRIASHLDYSLRHTLSIEK